MNVSVMNRLRTILESIRSTHQDLRVEVLIDRRPLHCGPLDERFLLLIFFCQLITPRSRSGLVIRQRDQISWSLSHLLERVDVSVNMKIQLAVMRILVMPSMHPQQCEIRVHPSLTAVHRGPFWPP